MPFDGADQVPVIYVPNPDLASLARIRELLIRKGWCQEVLKREDGTMCLQYAIMTALGITDKEAIDHPLTAIILRSAAAVTGCNKGVIPVFNDAPGRTFEQILAVLRHAYVQHGGDPEDFERPAGLSSAHTTSTTVAAFAGVMMLFWLWTPVTT